MKRVLICVVVCLLTSPSAGRASQGDEQRAVIDALDARCAAALEAVLEPLRRQKIDTCTTVDGKDPAWCEQFFATWGYGTKAGNGARSERFDDLQECVEAFDARHNVQ